MNVCMYTTAKVFCHMDKYSAVGVKSFSVTEALTVVQLMHSNVFYVFLDLVDLLCTGERRKERS